MAKFKKCDREDIKYIKDNLELHIESHKVLKQHIDNSVGVVQTMGEGMQKQTNRTLTILAVIIGAPSILAILLKILNVI